MRNWNMTTRRLAWPAVSLGTCRAVPDPLLSRWRFHVPSRSGRSPAISRLSLTFLSPPPAPTPGLLAKPGGSTCETYSGLNYFSPLRPLPSGPSHYGLGRGHCHPLCPCPCPQSQHSFQSDSWDPRSDGFGPVLEPDDRPLRDAVSRSGAPPGVPGQRDSASAL